MIAAPSASSTTSTLFASPPTSPTPSTPEPTFFAALSLLFFPPHHLSLSLCTFCFQLLGTLFDAYLRLLQVRRESWVCAVFTMWSCRAETTQIKGTYLFLFYVSEGAMRA